MAVDSTDADPKITVTSPSGAPVVFTFTAEDPGSSSFRPPSSPGWVWHFNWQTDDDTGNPLPKGSYRVEVTSRKTGQTFDGGTIVLK